MNLTLSTVLFVTIAAIILSSVDCQLSFGKDWHPNGKRSETAEVPATRCAETMKTTDDEPSVDPGLLRAARIQVTLIHRHGQTLIVIRN